MGYPRVPDAAAVYVNTTDPCRAVCWRAALHDLAMRLVDRVVRHRDARVPKEALVGLDARVRHAHHLCRIALQHGALHNLIACCTLVLWRVAPWCAALQHVASATPTTRTGPADRTIAAPHSLLAAEL
jgi:hypothetical protein